MEMIRRLKRLEKFELQQALKSKMNKPKLLSQASNGPLAGSGGGN
jgi:hypothetical protein